MHTDMRLVAQRQQDLLAQAQEMRRASCLRMLRRLSRRAERAQQRLSRAQRAVRRVSGELDASWEYGELDLSWGWSELDAAWGSEIDGSWG